MGKNLEQRIQKVVLPKKRPGKGERHLRGGKKKMKKIMYLIVLCLTAINVYGINIDKCQDINNPGQYNLNTNIINTTLPRHSPCIKINANNVLFNCSNYMIHLNDLPNDHIVINSSNVTT